MLVSKIFYEAIDAGAEIVYGGSADESSLRIEPTILLGDLANTALLSEEIFGPIMPIMIYDDLEELVTELQQRPRPLGLYVFTRRKKTVNYILERCPSGGVCINDTILHISNPNLLLEGIEYLRHRKEVTATMASLILVMSGVFLNNETQLARLA